MASRVLRGFFESHCRLKVEADQIRFRFRFRRRNCPKRSFGFGFGYGREAKAEFRFRPKLNSGRPKLAGTGLRASDVLVLACIKYKPGLYQHRAVGYTGEAASAVDVYTVARMTVTVMPPPHTAAAVTRPRQPVL